MKLVWMAEVFEAEGLVVVQEPEWKTRGRDWNPSGGMIHHTAPPVPFAVRQLYEKPHGQLAGQIKANFNVKPDGTVHVIAAGAATFASGKGSSVVLSETRSNLAPSGTATARGLVDERSGNPHYVNCEADHAGDGSAMPAVQERAVVKAYAALFRKLGWPAARLIGHCEWTRRKIDPRWNGAGNRTPTLRTMLAAELVGVRAGGTPS